MAHKQEQPSFQECLKQIEAGRPLEKVLADQPEAEAFRPDLEAARWLLARRESFAPRPGFVAASRRRLVTRLQAKEGRRTRLGTWWHHTRAGWQMLARSPVFLVVLVLLLIGTSVQSGTVLSRAAPTWLPGDGLYPLRSASERVALVAAVTPSNQAGWHIEFARRRLLEAQALVFEGRYEYIPAVVSDLNRHVELAANMINRISLYDLDQARSLASRLQNTLYGQNRIISVLVKVTPLDTGRNLQRALAISQSGMSAVRNVFAPGSGGPVSLLASLLPMDLAPPAGLLAWRDERPCIPVRSDRWM